MSYVAIVAGWWPSANKVEDVLNQCLGENRGHDNVKPLVGISAAFNYASFRIPVACIHCTLERRLRW